MREVIDLYVAKRDCPSAEAFAELSLPATPYELLDVMDRVRPGRPDQLDYSVERYHRGFEFLAPYILPAPDLFGLNALAEKLSELDDRQAVAFHGLVQMEAQKQKAQLSMQKLLDLAYSTDCCHVVDALNDSQLGRFYVDNDFFPEGDNIPEYIIGYLDYATIGKEMREAEGGVFIQGNNIVPGGYVVQHSDLKQAPPIPIGPPKPDAVLEGAGVSEIDEILLLTTDVDEYTLESGIRGVEDVAEDELRTIMSDQDAERVMKHMNLYAYGKEVLARTNAEVTHYGLLARKDGQPIQTPVEPEHEEQEPSQGGMEMM